MRKTIIHNLIHVQHDGDCPIYSSMANNFCTDGICTCGFGHEYAYLNNGDDKNLFSNERLKWLETKAQAAWRKDKDLRKKAKKMVREVFNGNKVEKTTHR